MKSIPIELINKILSYRPAHPIALLMKHHVKKWESDLSLLKTFKMKCKKMDNFKNHYFLDFYVKKRMNK